MFWIYLINYSQKLQIFEILNKVPTELKSICLWYCLSLFPLSYKAHDQRKCTFFHFNHISKLTIPYHRTHYQENATLHKNIFSQPPPPTHHSPLFIKYSCQITDSSLNFLPIYKNQLLSIHTSFSRLR